MYYLVAYNILIYAIPITIAYISPSYIRQKRFHMLLYYNKLHVKQTAIPVNILLRNFKKSLRSFIRSVLKQIYHLYPVNAPNL